MAGYIQRREQLGHVVADVAQHLLARLLGRGRDPPHDGRADDQAVGHRGEQLHVLRRADAEADADRQLGLRAQPADVVDQLRRQLRSARR